MKFRLVPKRICIAALALAALLLAAAGFFCMKRGSASAFTHSGDFTAEEQTEDKKFTEGSELTALYAVPVSAFTYENNGGGAIEKAFDGDYGTQWTSEKQNTRTDKHEEGEFVNTVTVTFKSAVAISRILYQASDARVAHGYPTQLELQYSESETGEFHSLGVCRSDATVRRVVFSFGEHTVRRIRLVFLEVYKAHNWVATAKEIVFLTEDDPDLEQLAHLFSDYAETQVKEGIDADFITGAREKYRDRFNYDEAIKPVLDRAEGFLNHTLQKEEAREFGTDLRGDNRLGRYGNIRSYCANTLKMSTFGIDYQPTGIAASAGTEITVYVEAEGADPLPNIVFTQTFGDWRSWLRRFSLSRGKNVFTFPDFIGENPAAYTVASPDGFLSGGPVYLENPYRTAEQSKSVKVYIEGGEFYPLYRKGGDTEEFLAELEAYREKLGGEPERYPDVVEMASDHVLITSLVSSAENLFGGEGVDPGESCEKWDIFLEKLLSFGGVSFDPAGAYYDEIHPYLRHNLRLAQPWAGALAYASGGFCGFCMGKYADDFALLNSHNFGWAMAHELGHSFDNNMGAAGRTTAEVTNNLWSIYDRIAIEENPSERYNAETFRNELAPDREPDVKSYEFHRGTGYVFWWQIESRYPGFWGEMENLYRYRSVEEDMTAAGVTDEEKKLLTQEERHAYLCSLAAKTDLTYYFDRWGFFFNLKTVGEGESAKSVPVSQFDAEKLSAAYKKLMEHARGDLTRPQLKFWYSDYWNYKFVSGGIEPLYNGESKTSVLEVFGSGEGYTVVLPRQESEAHLGYEILESGNVIGFTGDSAFTDLTIYPKGYTPSYSVRAYDRLLNASAVSTAVSPAHASANVCKIGDARYTSFADALRAAEAGDTVELIAEARTSAVSVEKNVTVQGNFSLLRGAAGDLITVKKGATLTLKGGENEREALKLDGSSFTQGGALVYVEEGGALVTQGCVIFCNNFSSGSGGAVRARGSLTLADAVFRGNLAKSGGAVHVENAHANTSFTNVRFENNTARENGGAISQCGTMSLSGCTFFSNSAVNGGAVYNFSGGVLTTVNTRIERNSAAEKGGGVYADGALGIAGGALSGNSARQGGGMYCAGGNGARKVTVGAGGTTVKFKSNIAEQGGALFVNSEALVTVNSVAVAGNRAAQAGGNVFYYVKGTFTFPEKPADIPDFLFSRWLLNGAEVTTFPAFSGGDYLDAEGVTKYYADFYADGELFGESELLEEGARVTLPAFTKETEKRRFTGWEMDGKLYAAGDSVEMRGDITAVAVFKSEYEATVTVNGEVYRKKTVAEDEPFTLPEAPEAPSGKVFSGWLVKNTLRSAGDEIYLTSDTEIAAQFDRKNDGLSAVIVACIAVGATGFVAMGGCIAFMQISHRRKRTAKK